MFNETEPVAAGMASRQVEIWRPVPAKPVRPLGKSRARVANWEDLVPGGVVRVPRRPVTSHSGACGTS